MSSISPFPYDTHICLRAKNHTQMCSVILQVFLLVLISYRRILEGKITHEKPLHAIPALKTSAKALAYEWVIG